MPLLRYRTGDISRLIVAPCRCGSPLKRLDAVEGTNIGGLVDDEDILLLRGIRRILLSPANFLLLNIYLLLMWRDLRSLIFMKAEPLNRDLAFAQRTI